VTSRCAFPLWLAPDQVRVITIGDDEALVNYAKQIVSELRAHEVRVVGDYGSDPMKAKITEAEKLRVTRCWSSADVTWKPEPFLSACTAKARKARSRDEAVTDIIAAIKERRA
jgi:threonyl-tRNA synthetase